MRRSTNLFAEAGYWRWWLRREAKAILLGLALAAILLCLALYALAQWRRPAEVTDATVVSFGTASTKLGNQPTVTVVTRAGRTLQLNTPPSLLAGCARGSPIRLVRRGTMTAIHRHGCRAPGSVEQ